MLNSGVRLCNLNNLVSRALLGPSGAELAVISRMARRSRPTAPNLVFHVIARGNHQEPTFRDPADYRAYLDRLARYRRKHRMTLYAYCLMPNHVHLLIRTSDVPLAKFMQSVQQSYTHRFNRVYGMAGHLFQGRYKAIVCDRDDYLVALLRYIHLNPMRAGLVARPGEYAYSSHAAYLRGEPTALVDPAPLLRLLGGRRAYRRVLFGDSTGDVGLDVNGEARGSDAGCAPGKQPVPSSLSDRRALPPVEQAIEALAAQAGVAGEVLRGRDRNWLVSRARVAALYVLVRRLGYRRSEVARAFGRDVATVSTLISRFSGRQEPVIAVPQVNAPPNCLDCKA